MVHLVDTPLGLMTHDQIAACFDLNRNTVIRRLWQCRNGDYPVERLFDQPRRQVPGRRKAIRNTAGAFPTPWGRLTLPQIAKQTGLSFGCVQSRLYQKKLSHIHAFNTPLRGTPGKDFLMPEKEWVEGLAAMYARERREREAWRARMTRTIPHRQQGKTDANRERAAKHAG